MGTHQLSRFLSSGTTLPVKYVMSVCIYRVPPSLYCNPLQRKALLRPSIGMDLSWIIGVTWIVWLRLDLFRRNGYVPQAGSVYQLLVGLENQSAIGFISPS